MASLAGKVISVTGAGSGIGQATAIALLKRGALVSVCDMNETALKEAVRTISGDFPTKSILATTVDIRDRTAVRNFILQTKAHFGKLDGCANVAGVRARQWANIWETSTEEYERIMDSNAKGVFNFLAEALTPGMMEDSGAIVNVSSSWGQRGLKRDSSYSASKHAINGLTRAVAKEAAERGIRVNAVAPGAVDTNMLDPSRRAPGAEFTTPIPRASDPEEIANVICFLLSDESSFVTGSVYNVDGGSEC